MALRIKIKDKVSTKEMERRMNTRSIRQESLIDLARMMHDTLIGDTTVRYLGQLPMDESNVDRPRRKERFMIIQGGKSSINRCRQLHNILNDLGFLRSDLKDKDEFVEYFKTIIDEVELSIDGHG